MQSKIHAQSSVVMHCWLHTCTTVGQVRDQLDVTLLHYLDGEAERMKAAGGGGTSLSIVAIIRARVSAEIDKTMGEEVSTLNRLLGFDDRYVQEKQSMVTLEMNAIRCIITFVQSDTLCHTCTHR